MTWRRLPRWLYATCALVAFELSLARAAEGPVGADPACEIRGIVVRGGDVFVALFLAEPRRNAWVPVGGRLADVEVLAHEAATNAVTLRRGASVFRVALRTAAQVASEAAEVEREKAERRMLVADLLEIGLERRQARREAAER